MSKQKLDPLSYKGHRVAGMVYDRKTDIVYLLKSIDGKKIKFSTGVKKDKVLTAKRIANAKLKELFGNKKTTITPLIKDELISWIRVKESDGLDSATVQKVHQSRPWIEPFWGNMYCHEITRDRLVDWYEWLNKTFKGKQKDNAVKYMRNFCRYLHEKQYNGSPLLPAVPKIADPQGKLVRAQRKKRNERTFSQEELTKVLSVANDVERLIGMIMISHATRIDETLNLRFDTEILMDESPPAYKWTIGQNKADLWGSHSLHPSLINHLKSLYTERKIAKTALLFPQKRDQQKPMAPSQIDWADWKTRAELGWNWSSKTFRHTCLTHLFSDEVNPQALICKLYRVSLAVALDTYIHPTPAGIEKMRCAVRLGI